MSLTDKTEKELAVLATEYYEALERAEKGASRAAMDVTDAEARKIRADIEADRVHTALREIQTELIRRFIAAQEP